MENVIKLDTVDIYNKLWGFETLNPLVAVVDMSKATKVPESCVYNYGLYALFLKQTKCGDIRYGRQTYDYQEGTVTSFAPGQVVEVTRTPNAKPQALGLLFHPDLIKGTSLGQEIRNYSFFAYASNEALHLSEAEKGIFSDCLHKIEQELNHSIDKHSKRLIAKNIELLLDYCMRFYDRQFITRQNANSDVLTRFEALLHDYFHSDQAQRNGLPTVKYFADKVFLSSNYFGDLVKKETGKTAQEYIQNAIIDLAKEEIADSRKSISQIAYELGFQYPQHFSRLFKKGTQVTPGEYRTRMRTV